ncbi:MULTISPECIES: glycine cleavage T C-terminal barrel domain-containing protein [Pseudonocardia]|uniref:Aminomethyltransferase n=2 Tax=Pseudonocardia TaxID=1847 RepID=A0A1Y2N9R9_PSEAH|nr:MULTISPECIES: glycine cleavage T C-terminal barrel domain-containing protein [Pseudonocardia]OSY43919.1 Aminomethyltransferase [Pseudonocardia autotrophica]TDN74348.1 glycine cleavage system T protein [Pseudonocardia autotrophica]BBG05112.1 hypothetical protein Pdca_63210 [Pseudonocardia autotrophica]GEC27907.1 hypothetical protein PSA01_49360 [Pseudonocardia saturnea]
MTELDQRRPELPRSALHDTPAAPRAAVSDLRRPGDTGPVRQRPPRAPRAAAPAGPPVLPAAGEVTGGVLSPTLHHPVAIAVGDRAVSEPGTALAVDVRGWSEPVDVDLPIHTRSE